MKNKIKQEKGITGIDIVISVFIITIFVATITTLFYTINSNSDSIERKTEAINYAITEIEQIKNMRFEEVEEADNTKDHPNGEAIGDTPYSKRITVIDYANMPGNTDKQAGIVKKATVEIMYKDGGETQTIQLSTILTFK